MKLSNYFDKIFIIGALNSPKVNNTIESLKKLNLYDENVNVHLYSPLDNLHMYVDMPCDDKLQVSDRLSLALAHYAIVKQAYDAGLNSVLILEDDNFFLNDINVWEDVFSKIPEDWDVLKFSGFIFRDQDRPLERLDEYMYNDIFRRIDSKFDTRDRWGWSASMIGYNRKSMSIYLESQKKMFNVADEVDGIHCFNNYEQDVNIYMPMIALVVPFGDLNKYKCSWYVRFNRRDFLNATIKSALCCIVKDENKYLREFVEHYKDIGFTHLFIYDNNEYNGERVEDVIGDYIDSGFVTLVQKFKGNYNSDIQSRAYQDCFRCHKHEYDWMAFFDADEFLMLEDKYTTISDVLGLSLYSGYDAILVCWKNYGDNNLITVENNDYSLVGRFVNPCPVQNDVQIKAIVRCSNKDDVTELHIGNCNYHSCNTNGEFITSSGVCGEKPSIPSYANMWLNHYRTKTLQEYIEIRMRKKNMWGYFDNRITFDYFFEINEKTPEKLKYIEDFQKNNKK